MSTNCLINKIKMMNRKLDESEEFNNFMHKVNEISKIISDLSSKDEKICKMATLQADKMLSNNDEIFIDENIEMKTKHNKTVINKVVEYDQATMDRDSFMKSIEKDVAQRNADRKIRKEKSDTLMRRANSCFRRNEYEKALLLYTEAISHTKDSCLLYTNRALTYINLKLYEKAIDDCKTAMKFNENSLKAWLYLIKSYYFLNDEDEYQQSIVEAKEKNPDKIKFIEEFLNDLKTA